MPYGDGLTNLTKYATGLGGDVPAVMGDIFRCGFDRAGGKLQVRYASNPLAVGVSLAVEQSADLRNWETVVLPPIIDTANALQTWNTLEIPLGEAARFYRLKAAQTE